MDHITTRVVRANECDTLIKEIEFQLNELLESERYLIAQNKEYELIRKNDAQIIRQKDYMIADRDAVIVKKEGEITGLQKEVKKQKRIKIIGMSVLSAAAIYFAVR